MIKFEDLTGYYNNMDTIKNKKNIYNEYLQYLIIKKLFNADFNMELCLSGSFYNRITFNINRFGNSIDLISKSVALEIRKKINKHLENSLKLEGYDAKIKSYKGQYKILFNFENDLQDEIDSELEDSATLTIYLNYFNQNDLLKNKASESIDGLNINKFDICTRVNTINTSVALTILVRKIIITNKITPIDLYDLIYFKNLNFSIDKNYFSIADQKNLLEKLFKISNKLSNNNINKELSPAISDIDFIKHSAMFYNKTWIKNFNI